jgi:NADH-quinone oxidoreductase subunit J
MTSGFEIAAFSICAFVAIAGALGMTTTMSMFRSGIFLMASFVGVAGLFILLAADLIGVLQIMMYIGGFLVMILFMVLVMHDPGGAMMAGMEMAFVERWFSKGLVPREAQHNNDAGPAHHYGHEPRHEAHQEPDHDSSHVEEARSPAQHGGRDHEHSQHGNHPLQHSPHGGEQGQAMHHGNADNNSKDMGGMDMSMVTPVRPVAAWLAGGIGVLLVSMLLLRPSWRVVSALPDPDSARRVGHLLMEKYMVAFEGAGFLILIGIFGAVLLARPSTYPDDSSRSARVAVDERPEPITDEGLSPLAERNSTSPHHHERARHSDGHGS